MNILNKQSKTPYYLQLSSAYEELIKTGYFSHGTKLPTLTEIKKMFNVSLKVAAQTYDDLNKRKLIYSRRGKGFYVSYHQAIQLDLNQIYNIEYQLIYEMDMEKHILLFEKLDADEYLANQLKIKVGETCYHVKQCFGKDKSNVLMQDVYLPANIFPRLEIDYHRYSTLPFLINNGCQFELTKFVGRYFSVLATAEHEVVLKLQIGDPLWRVKILYYTRNDRPLALVNNYLSGEHVTMVVMLNAY